MTPLMRHLDAYKLTLILLTLQACHPCLQAKYLETLALADRWRSAFKQVASMCGYTLQTGKEPDVPAVLESVQRLKAAEASLQVCVCLPRSHPQNPVVNHEEGKVDRDPNLP